MNTNARPLSGGIASKNVRNASRPPAEAPMPTTIGPGVPQSAAVSEDPAAVRRGTAASGLAGAGLRAVFDRSADLFAAIATYPRAGGNATPQYTGAAPERIWAAFAAARVG